MDNLVGDSHVSNLLMKFSMACNIMPYYCHVGYCHYMMTRLSNGCKTVWEDHSKAFIKALSGVKVPVLTHKHQFNSEIAYSLLKNPLKMLGSRLKIDLTHEPTSKNRSLSLLSQIQIFHDFLQK